MSLAQIARQLIKDLQGLRFGPPVSHVYNPLIYAGEAYDRYLGLYGQAPKEVLLLGMNPGPWGMAQTGVPFGEVRLVRDWLKIAAPIGSPAATHPKRPVTGFACPRSEVSGARLWGWARETFQTPERFFARFFVANYCPLLFIEAGGRNRTPDRLPPTERGPLLAACDRALRRSVELLTPRHVVGVGKFAETRALQALAGLPVVVGRLTHPSPANPAANRGWGALAARELADLGISLETPGDP
jgi:single-strand selective monofunctional uracil DNA glycosylase